VPFAQDAGLRGLSDLRLLVRVIRVRDSDAGPKDARAAA
jgi:hypothetical protein